MFAKHLTIADLVAELDDNLAVAERRAKSLGEYFADKLGIDPMSFFPRFVNIASWHDEYDDMSQVRRNGECRIVEIANSVGRIVAFRFTDRGDMDIAVETRAFRRVGSTIHEFFTCLRLGEEVLRERHLI